MAHEILSVKLCQLDDKVGRLHSRIHISETANHRQLSREIEALRQECTETELSLREKLRLSKSDLVSVLSKSYEKMEQLIQDAKAELQAVAGDCPDDNALAEAKILLAEYALDFAHQAADRALLISMDVIDTELMRQEQ